MELRVIRHNLCGDRLSRVNRENEKETIKKKETNQ